MGQDRPGRGGENRGAQNRTESQETRTTSSPLKHTLHLSWHEWCPQKKRHQSPHPQNHRTLERGRVFADATEFRGGQQDRPRPKNWQAHTEGRGPQDTLAEAALGRQSHRPTCAPGSAGSRKLLPRASEGSMCPPHTWMVGDHLLVPQATDWYQFIPWPEDTTTRLITHGITTGHLSSGDVLNRTELSHKEPMAKSSQQHGPHMSLG